ncbi:hypothetical protein LX64_01079 [Chitinophaga skermanii]|uniref:Uncharacterized protein n=1 Tax=Chitinophaga skermanii TaxID=331697 RepID=A0A327QX98_9BACT|nr:hypothetical protein [Chitinophaga skermanii]RAJ08428.1 hypothetical protein LX64_01079 [Chitinophaga skermanii]
MSTLLPILRKVLQFQFYKQHAGFFFLAFMLLFGLIDASQIVGYHVSLMRGMASTPWLCGLALLGWTLYSLKINFFTRQLLRSEGSMFLLNLQACSPATRWWIFWVSHVEMMLPVIVYTWVASVVFVADKTYGILILFLLYPFVLCTISAYLYVRQLMGVLEEKELGFIDRISRLKIFQLRSYYFVLLKQMLHERKLALFIAKVGSFGILYIAFTLNETNFEKGEFFILYHIIISAHAVIIYYMVQFLENKLAGLRQWPLHYWQRFTIAAIPCFILLLPEMVYMILHGQHMFTLPEIGGIYFFSAAQLCVFFSLLYLPRMNMDRYLVYLFTIFAFSIFMMLLKMYWLYGVVELLLAITIYRLRFERFEQPEGEK